MNMTCTLSLSLSVALSTLALGACSDPVGDKPRATVEAPSTPAASATAPDATPPAAGTTRFVITPETSKITFVGAKVTGKHDGGFKSFKGVIDVAGEDVSKAKVDVEIDMASVWTDTEKLTGHLKSADFFDVAKFPTARFVSTKIEPGADGAATITGDFTLHGVTKSISFPAKVTTSKDGGTAQAEFGINRKDFGIVYPGKPDDLIRDEVLMKLDIQAKPATPGTGAPAPAAPAPAAPAP